MMHDEQDQSAGLAAGDNDSTAVPPPELPHDAATLECQCCGCEGATAGVGGLFIDGQRLKCGCPGWVSIDEEDGAWINNGDERCEQCENGSGKLAAFREAQRAIRENCGACDGHGFTIETGTDSGHACDGTEESCLQNCPVPIPIQVQEQCEYCGRPIAEIEKLIQSVIATDDHSLSEASGSFRSAAPKETP